MLENLSYLELSKTLSWIKCYKNIYLGRKDISNKLMISGSDRKKPDWVPLFGRKRPCVKRIRWKYALFCLDNDKNNAIADKVLIYF